jgi:hypothetical protein
MSADGPPSRQPKGMLSADRSAETQHPETKSAASTVSSRQQSIFEKIGRVIVPKSYKHADARKEFCDAITDGCSPFVRAIGDYVRASRLPIRIESRPAGVLMKQDDPAHEMYVILLSDGRIFIQKEETHSIGDLLSDAEKTEAQTTGNMRADCTMDIVLRSTIGRPLPFTLGEMALNPDNQYSPKRSATIENEGTVRMVVITKEQYLAMRGSQIFRAAESAILRERNKNMADMINSEKLERTKNLLRSLKALRDAESYTGHKAEEALDLRAIDMDQLVSKNQVEYTFWLIGYSKGNKKRACEFTVRYTLSSTHDNIILIHLTAPSPDRGQPSDIQLTYILPSKTDHESVHFDSVEMGDNAGYGFTTMMYHILLQYTPHVGNRVTEAHTTAFLKENRDRPLSHAELSVHSPIVAGRKGFMSIAEKDHPRKRASAMDLLTGAGDIDSYRIGETLEKLLDQATRVERHLLEIDKEPKERNKKVLIETVYPECTLAQIIEQLRSGITQYREYEFAESSEYEGLQAALDIQIQRIEDLYKEHCVGSHAQFTR